MDRAPVSESGVWPAWTCCVSKCQPEGLAAVGTLVMRVLVSGGRRPGGAVDTPLGALLRTLSPGWRRVPGFPHSDGGGLGALNDNGVVRVLTSWG